MRLPGDPILGATAGALPRPRDGRTGPRVDRLSGRRSQHERPASGPAKRVHRTPDNVSLSFPPRNGRTAGALPPRPVPVWVHEAKPSVFTGDIKKRNLPPWQGKVSGVSRPSLEPRPKTERGAYRDITGSHAGLPREPRAGDRRPVCLHRRRATLLALRLRRLLGARLLRAAGRLFTCSLLCHGACTSFLIAEFTGHQIFRQRFFSVASSFFT
jgi:hypothetical protein